MTTVEKLLPAFYLLTTQHAELQRVIFNVLRRADNDMAFTLRQLFPSTASGWGLDIWEEAYGIPTDRTNSAGGIVSLPRCAAPASPPRH